MQELSSLGRFSVQVLRVRLYSSARNLVSLPGTGTQGRRRKSAKARRMEAKRGSKKKKEQKERERERERWRRRRTKQAIRSRAGCVQLEEKLEICGCWRVGGSLGGPREGTLGYPGPSVPLLSASLLSSCSVWQKGVADCEWQLSEPELTSPSSTSATHRPSSRYDTSFPAIEFLPRRKQSFSFPTDPKRS